MSKKISNFFIRLRYLVLGLVLSLLPTATRAYGNTSGDCVKTKGAGDWLDTAFGCISTKGDTLVNFVRTFYQYALFFGATVAVIMIVLGGIQYITSSGNPDAIQSAKDRITSALWGFGMLLLASVLFRTIGVGGEVIR